MGLFRNKSESTEVMVTEPVQQRAWLVWLLSIVTFFLTVAIVLGLFWAGRWVVHQFTKQPTTTPVAAPVKQNESGISNTREGAAKPTTPSTSAPATATGTVQPTPPASATTTPPATPSALVNTGPDSDE